MTHAGILPISQTPDVGVALNSGRRSTFVVASSTIASLLVAAFVTTTVLLLVTGHTALLPLAFPAMAVATALVLFVIAPAWYMSLVWSLWIVTPFVRRVVDAHNGFNPQSPILLTPLLVCALCVIDAARFFPMLRGATIAPFWCAMACLVSGVAVGLTQSAAPLVFYAAFTWGSPLLLGVHIMLHPERYDQYKRAMLWTMSIGMIVLAIYGFAQFYMPAPWDRLWMVNSRMDSIGSPEPFQVRVFSLMNAPGPLGEFLSAALVLVMASRVSVKVPSIMGGVGVLLLSLSRSAWLGFGVGFTYLLLFVAGRARKTALAIILAVTVVVTTYDIVKMPRQLLPLRKTVQTRVTTMTDLSMDVSFRARSYLIPIVEAQILEKPFGTGLGSTLIGGARGTATSRLADQGLYLDNGVLETFLVLGWFGGAVFLLSAVAAIGFALRSVKRGSDSNGFIAASLAVFAQLISGTIFFGVGGAVFWSCTAMAIISASSRENLQSENASEPGPQ